MLLKIASYTIMVGFLFFVGNALYLQVITNRVVVAPVFTYSAYEPDGFYSYYKGKCSTDCLTVPEDYGFNPVQKYSGSFNAVIIAYAMGYKVDTDGQVADHPENYNNSRLIVLHNEYVTQSEFNLLNSSKGTVFMYPNANYGLVYHDMNDSTITLLADKSHKTNAFGWVYDNTKVEKTFCSGDTPLVKKGDKYFFDCWTQDPIQIAKELFYLEFKRT